MLLPLLLLHSGVSSYYSYCFVVLIVFALILMATAVDGCG